MFEASVPDVNIDKDGTLGGLLRDRAARHPDRPFLTVAGRSYTFGELDERSDALARGLADLGVNRGDRVAWLSTNRAEVVELFFAIAKLGAIQVPLNAFLRGSLLSYQINQCQASVLVTDASGSECVDAVIDDLPLVQTFIELDTVERNVHNNKHNRVHFSSIESNSDATLPDISPRDTFAIMYTSGTTGASKGCVLNHGYHLRDALAFGEGIGLSSDDTLYTSLPLFHMASIISTLLSALVWEIHAVIDDRFSASAFFPRAREVDATVSVAIAAMAAALLATPPKEDDRNHSLRAMTIVPCTPEAQLAFEERFGISVWAEMYGQTECIPVSISSRLGERDRAGAGAPMKDLEVALFDDDGYPVAEGEVGEIVLRPKGPFSCFERYWNMPEETVDAFRGLWYHTGDLGRMLPSGQIAFADRKKDCLRRRGENISSMEVESVIIGHESIAEVAVLGVPSPMGEDDVKACIVVQAGASVTPEELFEFFSTNLPFFMMPRYVEVLSELPRTAVGRVQKFLLRERAKDGGGWDFEKLGLSMNAAQRRGIGAGAKASSAP